MLIARYASPQYFFRNKRKNKKKESRLSGGVAALSRFLEKYYPC